MAQHSIVINCPDAKLGLWQREINCFPYERQTEMKSVTDDMMYILIYIPLGNLITTLLLAGILYGDCINSSSGNNICGKF